MSVREIAERIAGTCLMTRARFASRVLTSLYDEEVRGLGLQATQITLLAAIGAYAPIRRTDISGHLHLDSSTLTRNLRLMIAKGWVEERRDDTDARALALRLTPSGEQLLEEMAPAWARAQDRAAAMLGADGTDAMGAVFRRLQASQGT